MSIVKMKKVRVVTLLSDKTRLIDRLTEAGCVQLENSYADALCDDIVHSAKDDTSSDTADKMQRLLSARDILKPFSVQKKKPLFADKRSISSADFFDSKLFNAAFDTVCRAERLSAETEQLNLHHKRLTDCVEQLTPWENCQIPLDFQGGEKYAVVFGVCPTDSSAENACKALADSRIAACAQVISSDSLGKHIVLISHRKSLSDALDMLKTAAAFSEMNFQDGNGTAVLRIKKIRSEIELIDARRREIDAELRIAAANIPLIEQAIDFLSVVQFKADAEKNMLFTGRTACFEGWLTATSEPTVRQILSQTGCAFEFSDPSPDEKVPIKLKSNNLTDPLNMVTEMYSLPSYDGIDPNALILPFFTVFFGIMFADLGYGIVLMLLALFFKKKFKPSGTIARMMSLIIMCGFTTAIAGIFFGGFFGDAIPVISETFFGSRTELWKLVDPMQDPISILVFSIVMGAVQIIAGMAIKAYMCIRDGHPLDALFDVGSWWLLFAGIAVMALGYGYWLALCGVAAIVLTQGRDKPTFFGKLIGGLGGLYNIITYASDALSYTRLMALLLATSVVASVINIIASISGNVFVFIIIFTFGHLFNMAVNIIGTYVHAARLQYLEFFSKFYKDGGKPFRPLEIKTKFVNVIREEI